MKISASVLVGVLAACGPKPTTDAPRLGAADQPAERLPGLDKRLLDTSADPCTDFFQYACGKFSQLYPIPSDRSSFGTGSMLKEYTDHALHDILDQAARPRAGRAPNEQKIGDAYAACMDEDDDQQARARASAAGARSDRRAQRPRPTCPSSWRTSS